MSLLQCEISIHAQPANCATNARGELQLPADWAAAPWGRTFDDALAAIGDLPQLYTEPDGSLAWNSEPGAERWQLFGCLYDRGPELAYIDLYGSCDCAALQKFFDCVRGSSNLMIQDRQQGIFYGEAIYLGR
jgi:hypothetical protein